VVAISAATVVGILLGTPAAAVIAAVMAALRRRVLPAVACLLLGAVGAGLGARSWAQAVPRHLGPFTGWVEVAADPAPVGIAMRTTFEVQGERFDAWLYGPARAELAARQSGELVWVIGTRTVVGRDARRAQVRHVVGRFTVQAVGDVLSGDGLARAGNRVRSALRRSADTTMSPADAALFTGLVIGDDVRQPGWMVADFRRSGLSHLTAVSGQNVAFVIAAATPLLRRLRAWWRWAATVGLVAWFMAITRFEPSVLRAGAMAMIAATAFVLGRQPKPVRLVALAVTALVLGDPMLVWSVGFWLSVGATAGVCTVGPWCAARLPGPHWLRLSVGVTLGAQVGVAVPSLLVFHRLPLVSVPANLAAVPVAGFVMLYGLPAGLAASMLPAAARRLVMAPAVIGTRWTATVAQVAAAVEPSGVGALMAWVVAGGLLAFLLVRGHRSRAAQRHVPF
jgi:competence protein ComEC